MVFGDIQQVRNIHLNNGESVSVPAGEIWKVNASCGVINGDINTIGAYFRITLNNNTVVSGGGINTNGTGVSAVSAITNEVYAESGDTLAYDGDDNGYGSFGHLSVVVMNSS